MFFRLIVVLRCFVYLKVVCVCCNGSEYFRKRIKKNNKLLKKICILGICMVFFIMGSNMLFCWCLEVVYLYKNKIE